MIFGCGASGRVIWIRWHQESRATIGGSIRRKTSTSSLPGFIRRYVALVWRHSSRPAQGTEHTAGAMFLDFPVSRTLCRNKHDVSCKLPGHGCFVATTESRLRQLYYFTELWSCSFHQICKDFDHQLVFKGVLSHPSFPTFPATCTTPEPVTFRLVAK